MRLDCCTPYSRSGRWAHSWECSKIDLGTGLPRRGQNVRHEEWITYYPDREQSEHEARRFKDYGCSFCGVATLPHLETCPTNPFFEVGREYSPNDPALD